MTLAPGTRLGPYEILSAIGAGGMGEVYKALDTRLERIVAVKVIAAAAGGDLTMRQRLLREARAASALNHPYICTIHDVGDEGARQFIAMEWLDGETVAARLRRSPAGMPLDEVMKHAAQLADALDAAHAIGIVHRDLKPANLFITRRGDVKILDFGLAKVVATAGGGDEAPTTPAHRHLTERGSAIGTDAYMSPEQARGEPVDARSDLFSLGAVLYEMVTGHQVFTRTTPALTFDAILNRRPPAPSTLNGSVPVALDRIVMRLLAKDPAARIQSAGELLSALDAPGTGLAARRPADASPSLAVLPLRNLSPDPENEYFADGMTEDIIDALAHVEGLRVAARTSSFAFKGKTTDLPSVAAELRVAHVLSGSLRRSGSRLRVSVELVEVESGLPLWSERYDRESADLFEIQDEIAAMIAAKLKVALTQPDETTRVRRPTDNLEAYELYLKGRFLINQRGAELRRGLQCFEQALALDPAFAPAHAGLGDAFALLGFYGYLPSYEAMPRARRFAQRAIDLDPSLAEPHSTLMFVSWSYDWDWDRTQVEFERAMALNPRLPTTLLWHALYLGLAEGNFPQAIAEAARAIAMDPLSGSAHATIGTIHLSSGDFRGAQAALERAIELDPRLWSAYRYLGFVLAEQNRLDEAVTAFERGLEVSNRHAWLLAALAETHHRAGRVAEAETLYLEMKARAAAGYVQPLFRMFMAAVTGRTDEAFEWFEAAYRERNPLPPMNYFTSTKTLTDDPRFDQILGRTGIRLAAHHWHR